MEFFDDQRHHDLSTVLDYQVQRGPDKPWILSGEQAFKMSAMPICSKLSDFEADGTHPGAWAIAKAAFPKVCESFVDTEGNVYINGRYRTIAVRKK